jgi:hypothetical protein
MINIPNTLDNEVFTCKVDNYYCGQPMIKVMNKDSMCIIIDLPITESDTERLAKQIATALNDALYAGVPQGQRKARIGLGIV